MVQLVTSPAKTGVSGLRRRLQRLMLVLAAVAGMANVAQAQGIAIDATNFPDVNFRTHVKQYDTDSDGSLGSDEIAAVKTIKVSIKNIADLKGIEHFTALTELLCPYNQLTTLDVSANTALTLLNCEYNQLTALDVSKNTALKALYCYRNQLTALDVSANTALTKLACFSNQIQADEMLALVNSLPTVTNGEFYVVDTQDSDEGNVITKAQVAIAQSKGWTVYDFDLKGQTAVEYAGVEEYVLTLGIPTNGTLTATPNGSVGEGTAVIITATPDEGYKLKP